MFATGIAITAGYHRLYAHRSYKTRLGVEIVLLWFATMATQGSVLRWTSDHRNHHIHVDSNKDPYSITKGFWYAHVLWIFHKPAPINKSLIHDLIKNKVLAFQDKYYELCLITTNVLTTLAVGFITHSYLGAFIFCWLLRMFLVHHFTWLINSLAHTWGERTYSKELSAVDNFVMALLTFGEGYHNYHHTFAHDYRNGIRWWHFDPTKWTIFTLQKARLAESLKRVNHLTIKKKLVHADKNLLFEKLKNVVYIKRELLEAQVHELSEKITNKLNLLQSSIETYKKSKNKEIKKSIKELKLSLKQDWKNWYSLCDSILDLKPSL